MSKGHFIRVDHWRLNARGRVLDSSADTIAEYRLLVNALCTIFLTHWPQCHDASVQTLERLFHNTALNPSTPYGQWFGKRFNRFPSYLRRAATMAALGAVCSFMTRYRAWQGGDRKTKNQRPPAWGGFEGYPVLYSAQGGAGAMVKIKANLAQVKLYSKKSKTWEWYNTKIISRGKRHKTAQAVLSPTLMLKRGKLSLVVPMELPRVKTPNLPGNTPQRVCAVDLGINSYATCSIIDENGSVFARAFLQPQATHIARRGLCFSAIQRCARKTMGGVVFTTTEGKTQTTAGKLSKGFCSNTYRRLANLNTEISRDMSRAIITFAQTHGANTIVFEQLKGFRPKAGAKRSTMKQKFHTWLHRKLVKQTQASCEEKGMRVVFVSPRGTSAWAYDGSGKVKRDKTNASLCVFANGKRYNADLNASYNIGARYFWRKKNVSSPLPGNGRGCVSGKSSRTQQRAPVVLSSLWAR